MLCLTAAPPEKPTTLSYPELRLCLDVFDVWIGRLCADLIVGIR
jgi:hypothetical protein